MIRKDKILERNNSSDCLIKQSGEFTHNDALVYINKLEQIVTDSFNIEKVEDDKQNMA